MRVTSAFVLLGLMSSVSASSLAAQVLTAGELSHCANMALELRTRSPELERQAIEDSARRTALAEMHGALAPGSDGDTERWIRYNAAATAFNERMQRYRQDVEALNVTKQRYHAACDGQDYRPEDLQALPAAQQEAMQRGLADIRVPYLAR